MTRRKSDSPQKAAMRTSYEDMDICNTQGPQRGV